MEACIFQGLTGQRIDKVLGVIDELDQRLIRLAEAFDVALLPETESDGEQRARELILNGPSQRDRAPDQEDVDRLFS